MGTHYYKFRSLGNIRYFLDILINERLYVARYDELNDPMEGVYLTDIHNENTIRLLREKKYHTRICSLSKDYKHTLLWTHYADSHKGCCIEISLSEKAAPPVDVNYCVNLPNISVSDEKEGTKLLSHKSIVWEYEKEARLFRKSNYVKVHIHKIIFGYRIAEDDYTFFSKLVKTINPNIEVSKMDKDQLYTGFVQ